MTEVLFYHLERQTLEAVLPRLLEKTIERGWRAVVQAASAERVEALSSTLWSYREESFLPHGSAADGDGELQPVWLTAGSDAPNAATVRFFVDGAPPENLEGLERAVYLFDGRDEAAVEEARERWKAIKAEGHAATYWQQDEAGRWVNRA
ncbi:MAG: DNA polymerase III subunit chi [Parvibaculaceae bacterium]